MTPSPPPPAPPPWIRHWDTDDQFLTLDGEKERGRDRERERVRERVRERYISLQFVAFRS